jgi:hypothetical protein
MDPCPYYLEHSHAVCLGAKRSYVPSLAEIEAYCVGGNHPSCPVLGPACAGHFGPFRDERYWLLGPVCTT